MDRQPAPMRTVHLVATPAPYPVRVCQREAWSLAEAGYEVIVVAPGSGISRDDRGVSYIGVPVPAGRLGRMSVGAARLVRAALAQRPDIVHIHAPAFLPWAFVLRALGRTVVFDAHEDLPGDIAYKHYIPTLLKGPAGWLAALVYRLAGRSMSAVLAPTEQVARRFGAGRAVIVQNFPRLAEFPEPDAAGAGDTSGRRFVYIGDLTEARGLRTMLDAAQRVSGDSISLVLGGRASTPNARAWLADEACPDNVTWLGWLERDRLPGVLSGAVAGLCVLMPYRSYREAQPVKVYEYMAMGLPVIASNFPEWRNRFGWAEATVFVDPADPEAIAAAMRSLANDPERAAAMGARGRQAVHDSLNWAVEEPKLVALYLQHVGPAS